MNDCIKKAYDAGKVSKETADELMTAENLEAALREKAVEKARTAREKFIQSVRISRAFDNAAAHPQGITAGINALLTKDMWQQVAYDNIEYLGRQYQGEYHAQVADTLSKFRTRWLGFKQDKAGLKQLIKALKNEPIDDREISDMAENLRGVFEKARKDFNSVGGSIPKSKKWDLPQAHNRAAVEKLGKETWAEEIYDMLDWDAMLDDAGRAIPEDERMEVLGYVWDTIVSDGLNKIEDIKKAPRGIGRKLARKHSQHRFLHFKDADSWMEYAEKYGSGDIFTTLTDHIDAMAHDVAMMEILGPNPQQTFDALMLMAKKDGGKPLDMQVTKALWNVVSGNINQTAVPTMADLFQGTRNLLTSAFLPAAFLSAVSDEGFKAVTSSFNGINPLKVFMRELSLLNPANEQHRIMAVRMGLIADSWTNMAGVGNRYADVYGTGVTTKITEAVLRGSWLTPYTEAGRKAFGMEFAAALADDFGKSFDQLSKKRRAAFERYGIDASDWDSFRRQSPLDYKGAKFADLTADGGRKFYNMVLAETDFAVPTPDARVRAITTGGYARGTWVGEGVRSVGMFKSFSITLMSTHIMRAAMQGGVVDKVTYAGMLVAATTIMGYVSLQLKDFAAGRNPREIDSTEDGQKLLAASILQGGGLGIMGDFLFADSNRFGGGFSQTLASPLLAAADDIDELTRINAMDLMRGEQTWGGIAADTSQFAKRYTPSIWQVRLLQNAMFDALSVQADPTYQSRYNRMMSKRMRDYKQDFWWKPGQMPDMPEVLE